MALKTTIQEIAETVGVSSALVSSILAGGTSNVRYGAKTRDRVLKVAEDLNYRQKEAKAVGLIHLETGHDPETDMSWVDYIHPLLGSINMESLKNDKTLSVFSYSLKQLKDELKNGNLPSIFKRRRIDGMIISGDMDMLFLKYLDEERIPWILMNANDANYYSYNSVSFDEFFSGLEATKYLAENGHKNILHITVKWSSFHYSREQRRAGYEYAMTQAGLKPNIASLVGNDYDIFKEMMINIFKSPDCPTAIFAYCEEVVFYCMRFFNELNIHDVQLICVAWQHKLPIKELGIPYVELPSVQMGKITFETLMKRIGENENVPSILLRGALQRP